MKNNLQFDFLVDKEKNTITFRKEFEAGRPLVWDCYTKAELLVQWFAPQPLTTKSKSMEFKEGGHWHYAMVEPNGTSHWGWTEFLTINPIDFYAALDGFCNEAGELNSALPRAEWRVTFTDKGENAMVETVITYQSINDLEIILQMGMKEGLTATLERLDDLLLTLKK